MKNYWLRGSITGLIIGILIFVFFGGTDCISLMGQLTCSSWKFENVINNLEDELQLVTNVLPLFFVFPILFGGFIGFVYGKIKNK